MAGQTCGECGVRIPTGKRRCPVCRVAVQAVEIVDVVQVLEDPVENREPAYMTEAKGMRVSGAVAAGLGLVMVLIGILAHLAGHLDLSLARLQAATVRR